MKKIVEECWVHIRGNLVAYLALLVGTWALFVGGLLNKWVGDYWSRSVRSEVDEFLKTEEGRKAIATASKDLGTKILCGTEKVTHTKLGGIDPKLWNEVGRVSADPDFDGKSEPRVIRQKTITFAKPFKTPPHVFVAWTAIDAMGGTNGTDAALDYSGFVGLVSKEKFELRIRYREFPGLVPPKNEAVFDDTNLSWMAIGQGDPNESDAKECVSQ